MFDLPRQPNFQSFSPSAKKTLLMAESLAIAEQAPCDTLHLLTAILENKDALASDILEGFKINKTKLMSVADKPILNLAPGYISLELKFALTKAYLEAALYEHFSVENEHLLLGVLSKPTMRAFRALERLNIRIEKIIEQVDFILSQTKDIEASEKDLFGRRLDLEGEDDWKLQNNGFIFPEPLFQQKPRREKLANYTRDLTSLAQQNKLEPLIGREEEIARIINILLRKNKNNPVLIGEAGVGKTAIVEGLAQKIVTKEVPTPLKEMRLLELDLSRVVAGTIYRGQFEERLKNLLEEISEANNIILFIDEIHTVIGAGSAEGSLDAASILKPILNQGNIRVIGATTLNEYKRIIRKDKGLLRRLQPVRVLAPSREETLKILKGVAPRLSLFHKVRIPQDILSLVVDLSDRYIIDRALPDKAIDLLDEACAFARARQEKYTEEVRKKLAEEDREKTLKMPPYLPFGDREEQIVMTISEKKKETIVFSHSVLQEKDVYKIISLWTGTPISVLMSRETGKIKTLAQRIKKRIVGQDEAVEEILKAIYRYKAGVADPNRPIGAYLFIGPTGVGKTELAKVIAEEAFGKDQLIRIDLSEFMEKHQTARLLGAPPGYVGYEEGSLLFEELKKKPHSVVLFDEIEKAHADFSHILLQIIEDGKLTDSQGNILDFRHTLIILTSNLGGSKYLKKGKLGFNDELNYNQSLARLSELVENEVKEFFLPEFLSRLSKVIIFKPLDDKALTKIITLKLRELKTRMAKNKIRLSFDSQIIPYLKSKLNAESEGARNVRKLIEREIEPVLAETIIKNPEIRKIKIGLNQRKIIGKPIG